MVVPGVAFLRASSEGVYQIGETRGNHEARRRPIGGAGWGFLAGIQDS